ncbi:MAG: sigma-70 family RNA polymerase sigma factor [Bacteroidota bacterium]
MDLFVSHTGSRSYANSEISSDLDLWDGFRNGGETEYSRIYTRYVDMLYRYGKRLCNDDQIVEDCIQDLFIDLWKFRASIQIKHSLKSYLLTSYRRRLMKQFDRKMNVIEEEDIAKTLPLEISIEQEIINKQHQKDRLFSLRSAISKLTIRQKEVIYLKFYSNLDYSEIAQIMDISIAAAYNLISKTLKLLKSALVSIFLLSLFL